MRKPEDVALEAKAEEYNQALIAARNYNDCESLKVKIKNEIKEDEQLRASYEQNKPKVGTSEHAIFISVLKRLNMLKRLELEILSKQMSLMNSQVEIKKAEKGSSAVGHKVATRVIFPSRDQLPPPIKQSLQTRKGELSQLIPSSSQQNIGNNMAEVNRQKATPILEKTLSKADLEERLRGLQGILFIAESLTSHIGKKKPTKLEEQASIEKITNEITEIQWKIVEIEIDHARGKNKSDSDFKKLTQDMDHLIEKQLPALLHESELLKRSKNLDYKQLKENQTQIENVKRKLFMIQMLLQNDAIATTLQKISKCNPMQLFTSLKSVEQEWKSELKNSKKQNDSQKDGIFYRNKISNTLLFLKAIEERLKKEGGINNIKLNDKHPYYKVAVMYDSLSTEINDSKQSMIKQIIDADSKFKHH